MAIKKIRSYQSGSLLLEAFIAIMVIGIAFSALLEIGFLSVRVSADIQKSSQANFLLKESMEAVRSFRDGTTWATNGLGSVSVGSANPYYLSLDTTVTPNTWKLTSGTETVGIFTRKVVFDNVYRDASSNIVTSGGTLDPNTKQVTVTVSWAQKSLQLVSYLTNWKP